MAMRVVRLTPPTVMGANKSLRVQRSMARVATTGMSSRSMGGNPGRVATKSVSPSSPASPAQNTVPIGGGVAWVRFSRSSAASRTTGVGVSVRGLMTRMSPWVRWHWARGMAGSSSCPATVVAHHGVVLVGRLAMARISSIVSDRLLLAGMARSMLVEASKSSIRTVSRSVWEVLMVVMVELGKVGGNMDNGEEFPIDYLRKVRAIFWG